ncbi:GGDEF domain-containing protein [Shewanella sp. JM162201]|uniref:diguanylate cyclase n=1 Tax=Shewanella jiangmenensis TaxID=2837387 RepID=A0ABS5V7T4_9GAMM|nr:GGDEF domain-containing protein [Shewanella jiangmenensis]MBT1446015.1 GGDEF domain-containing protein [Shewanella jiangmenensis]
MHRISHIPKPAALLFHVVAMITLLSYCAYRLYLGDWALVAIYSLSLLPLTLSFLKELNGISSHVNRRVTLLMVSIGIAATSLEIGYGGLIFVFPTIFIYFFLFPLTEAFVLSMLFGALSLACGAQTEPMDLIVRFGVAGVNCVIFGAIFAYIISSQHSNLMHLAITDPLTGLYNRKKLNSDLEALPEAPGAALLLVDIDHFKRINDVAGHLEGDRVLKEVGALIQGLLPNTAQAYRYGGEEFLLIFRDIDDARTTCEHLRQGLMQIIRPDMAGKAAPLTCSMGLAARYGEESAVHWLKRADIALYRAKNAGRDCVCVAESPVTLLHQENQVSQEQRVNQEKKENKESHKDKENKSIATH